MTSVLTSIIKKISGKMISSAEDNLAVEEPLEIRLSYVNNNIRHDKNISVTMRTPGNDAELAIGFLFTEGIIENHSSVEKIIEVSENIISVYLKDNIRFDLNKLERNFYTTSSCGVCGKSSIQSITVQKRNKSESIKIHTYQSVIYSLPQKLREHQIIFDQTGGLHASALFDIEGNLVGLREDVGRHNALDKLIGGMLQQNKIPLSKSILLLSGRVSFELMQKSFMADIPIVAAAGAPSSLAVEFAREKNITLIGFLKADKFNIYSGEERIQLLKPEEIIKEIRPGGIKNENVKSVKPGI
jgi:FdhD protein